MKNIEMRVITRDEKMITVPRLMWGCDSDMLSCGCVGALRGNPYGGVVSRYFDRGGREISAGSRRGGDGDFMQE